MATRRVAIYARVSTSDKDQDPETQLLPLREFVASQGSATRMRTPRDAQGPPIFRLPDYSGLASGFGFASSRS